MKKILVSIIFVVAFVGFLFLRNISIEQDNLSGTYLGVGEDFAIELRVNNVDQKVEWFLDVKDSKIVKDFLTDSIEIDVYLESGISLSLTDEENVITMFGDRGESSILIDSLPKEVRIMYNNTEELIALDLIESK